MSRSWYDDDAELRPVKGERWLILLIPALFIIGCIVEVMIG